MAYLRITGGKKLRGTVTTQSAKNAAEAILCACLLIRGRVQLIDVPQIEGVNRIVTLMQSIGVSITRHDERRTMLVDASGPLRLAAMDRHAAVATRTALLLMGALAARVQRYRLYKSGGCHLGERTVHAHVYALKQFGISVVSQNDAYTVRNRRPLNPARVVMYESGDTATENAILAAVQALGTTTIKLASANYMVQDLCYFLVAAGATITGIGTTTLTIEGGRSLQPVNAYPVMPDPIVSMTFIAVALTTNSKLTITNCPIEFLELELAKLQAMGARLTVSPERLSKNGYFKIVDITVSSGPLQALPDKIYGRPFPGLNIDNLPLFIPVLTQATGRTLVHDWAYENRAVYGLELQKLGARVTLLDPHRLWVEGKTALVANELRCPPALRPAVNILIAMLAARGTSRLNNAEVIDRGYENLYHVLNSVGAHIETAAEKS